MDGQPPYVRVLASMYLRVKVSHNMTYLIIMTYLKIMTYYLFVVRFFLFFFVMGVSGGNGLP